MGKTAQLKLTSEQRCRAAFERRYERSVLFVTADGEKPSDRDFLWFGWAACWQHLEKEVMREFIER